MKKRGKKAYKSKEKQKQIAKERIGTLFKEADKAFPKDKALADRYVQLARKISMKYRVRLGSELKKRFCKHCYSYLKPGVNCRVRVADGKLVYYCLECKHFMRFPYKGKKKR